MAVDGQGGVFAVWEDHRRIGFQDIYAQRYFAGGPTPTLLALVRFEAHPDRVVLTWHGSGDGATRATIYRRTDAVGWLPLGEASFDASGTLRYEDRSVTPGGRYAYRLGVRESGSETFSDETWVDVPAALELALEGLRPNPAVDRLRVALTLPRAGRATLELLDVTGRTVLEREVGTLGPGRHLVALGEGRKVAPGVYWLRLTADQRMLVVRAVVMR
jgi:hypothetical protein